jgi:glyoxylase-like metal-dependent hydrolase (beta-lactamase superfamily II)
MFTNIPKRPALDRAFAGAALALAFALGAFALAAAPAPALAGAPMAKSQAPGYYRLMLGDFEVTALSDGTIDLAADKLLKAPPAKIDQALARAFLAEPVETSVNGFLVNTGARLVLIDAGAGTLFGPRVGKLVENLKAAGYRPEQVDDVFITHLHPDHVGGIALNGAAVFPNATIHAAKPDAEYWLSQENLDKAPKDSKMFFQGARDSLKPYIDAGRFQPFTADADLVPGVRSWGTHGHTAGHTSYVVESKGQRLVVIGDLIHFGSVQFDDPSITVAFDTDAKAAAAERALVFGRVAKGGDLMAAAHLPFPGIGHLRAAGKGWQWTPVNYTQPR